ncbi:MAG: AAA family ATPase, partial [Isosphaeraceae bacterium]|nr:AAA family ATPase [Isosphaeraceae bacterium]
MNDSLQKPLDGIAVYNPDLLSKSQLVALFVARGPLLQRLLDDLRHHGASGSAQHHLLVGQRGMGKTTLLRRLRYAIDDEPELSRYWLPLTFPEEQYNVARLSDFYLNCIDALGDALEQSGRHEEAAALDAAVQTLPNRDEAERASQGLRLLMDETQRTGRRLVLLIDNLDLILDRLKNDGWTLRELLSQERGPVIVGASVQASEGLFDYGQPFYDYFQIHELRGLSADETQDVLRRLAREGKAPEVERILDRDPARLRTLHNLTGGNPRTIVLLYNVLATGIHGDVRSDLQRLLDLSTPLYKARFEALSAQAQQVMDALAIHWDPTTAGELAELARLETNVVSSQLNRLVQDGLVEKVAYFPGKKTGFQVAERFFNIWYLMRASRRLRQRLIWLVEFLRMFFTPDELRERARHHLKNAGDSDPDRRLKHIEYSLALAQAIPDDPLKGALESTALRSLVGDESLRREIAALLDLEGKDASLKGFADRHQMMDVARQKVFAAKPAFKSWSPDQFWVVLSGCPSFTPAQKLAIASALDNIQEDQFVAVKNKLIANINHVTSLIGSKDLAATVIEAIRQGYMAATEKKRPFTAIPSTDQAVVHDEVDLGYPTHWALEDLEGARIATEALGERELPALALAVRLSTRVDSDMISELWQELAHCRSPIPYVQWAYAAAQTRLDPAEIEWAATRGASLCERNGFAWGLLGNLRTILEQPEQAEAAYRRAIEVDPNYVHAYCGLGNLLTNDEARAGEAEAAFRRAIEVRPTYAYAWDCLGDLLAKDRARASEAEAAYQRAIEVDPNYVHAYCGLGNLLTNDEARAGEAAFRRAIEVRPTYAYAWDCLGDLLAKDRARASEA